MSLRRVDLNLLTVFDAIYAEGNLTRAAERIGMSQPAMSNALSRLRHVVGDPLFVRDGRGIQATARATELAPLVRQALSLIEGGLDMSSAFDTTGFRQFSIAGFDYYEVVLLPALCRHLEQRAPNLQLRSETGTSTALEKALRYAEIDLLVDYIPLKGDEYLSDVLFCEELVVLARRDHPTIGDVLDLETFAAQHFIVGATRADEGIPEIDQILRGYGLTRHVSLSITNLLALPGLTAGSDVICVCPRQIAMLYADQYDLAIHALPFEVRPIPVYMFWHESQDRLAAHRWLRAQVKRACRSLSRAL